MPTIPYPNVPNVPGVPAIPRLSSGSAITTSLLGALQGSLFRAFQTNAKWGIYNDAGEPLGDPSKFGGIVGGVLDSIGIGGMLSTINVDYSKETRVSDFPVERGSFASYNKVEMPGNPTVTLAYGGTESDRATFLNQIDDACKSTELFSVVTPDVTYINYSIERYDYERNHSKGASLLQVEISLKEIREVSARFAQSDVSSISNPKDVGAFPNIDSGKVQVKVPDTSTLKSLATKFFGLF